MALFSEVFRGCSAPVHAGAVLGAQLPQPFSKELKRILQATLQHLHFSIRTPGCRHGTPRCLSACIPLAAGLPRVDW